MLYKILKPKLDIIYESADTPDKAVKKIIKKHLKLRIPKLIISDDECEYTYKIKYSKKTSKFTFKLEKRDCREKNSVGMGGVSGYNYMPPMIPLMPYGPTYSPVLGGPSSTPVINDITVERIGDLIIEESTTNFGHNNLILQGNLSFPPRGDYIKEDGGYGYISQIDKYGREPKPAFDKLKAIQDAIDRNNFNEYKNQKELFKLYRYSYKTASRPCDTATPTLCCALFMPNQNVNFKDWTKKYLASQLLLIIAFKYYVPEGNIRYYFDWYMLNRFMKLSGYDMSLCVTAQIENYNSYFDFEEEGMDVKRQLNDFYNELKKLENVLYKNGLERFIDAFTLASNCVNNNGTLQKINKGCDLFVYKLDGPFIENKGQPFEGHITNGFIGQHMRYTALRQSDYTYYGQTVKRGKHYVFRDAHTNVVAWNDHKIIKELYENTKDGKTVYFLPVSIHYIPGWNDVAQCNSDPTRYYTRSAVAGWVQIVNYSNDSKFMTDIEYYKSIGIPFIMTTNKELVLLKHRATVNVPWKNDLMANEYNYGIEEYILTSFFRIPSIVKKSLYIQHDYANKVLDWNSGIMMQFELLLIEYLLKNNLINATTTRYDFFKALETLRETGHAIPDNSVKSALRLLLYLFPNKYMWLSLVQSPPDNYDILYHNIDINKIKNKYYGQLPRETHDYYKNLTMENLNKLNIGCRTAIYSPVEWCIQPYMEKPLLLNDCPPENFYSGFYNDPAPSLDIGIIRGPLDIKKALSDMMNNKLKIKLNRSDYKLNVESTKFKDAVMVSIDNNDGHIKPAIQNIVLKFGPINVVSKGEEIAELVSGINTAGTGGTQSAVWVPLIWKALNYAGYDVPPEWFNNVNVTDVNMFNKLVKELSSLPGWAEYAVYVLINSGTIVFNNDDNDFFSDIVVNKAQEYAGRYKTANYSDLRMATYIKYMKYKNKYMMLKNNIL